MNQKTEEIKRFEDAFFDACGIPKNTTYSVNFVKNRINEVAKITINLRGKDECFYIKKTTEDSERVLNFLPILNDILFLECIF